MDRKILITGTGIISAMGRSTREVAMNLYKGKCGLYHDDWRGERGFQSDLCGVVYDAKSNEDCYVWSKLKRAQYCCLSQPSRYAVSAVKQALEEAKVTPEFLREHNVSIIVSNDSTALESSESFNIFDHTHDTRRLDAGTVFRTLNSTVSMVLATILGVHGLTLTVSAACAGGGHAIGLAKMLLDSRQTEMVIVIGAQETNVYSTAAFDALGVFSPDKVQPFGKGRNGLAPSGGAACIILEPSDSLRLKEEKVHAFASLSGYGFSTNGKAITTPDAYQEEVAMVNAIENAGLDEGVIDVVLAHATGTPMGDEAEAKAIENIFPICPNVVATKGMTGHECWMAGVSQAVQAVAMFAYGRLFHAATTEENAFPKLNLVMRPKYYDPHHILCNAFGFGGTNSAFVVSNVKC